MGGQSTYIPLKVNSAGVIPVIFATSVLFFPALIATSLPQDNSITAGSRNWIDEYITFPTFLSNFFECRNKIIYIFSSCEFNLSRVFERFFLSEEKSVSAIISSPVI